MPKDSTWTSYCSKICSPVVNVPSEVKINSVLELMNKEGYKRSISSNLSDHYNEIHCIKLHILGHISLHQKPRRKHTKHLGNNYGTITVLERVRFQVSKALR